MGGALGAARTGEKIMAKQLYRTKSQFKATKQFAAGYGAVEFRDNGNPSVVHMVGSRPLASTGVLQELPHGEVIPRHMLASLTKQMKPYAVTA
jgi:hypothetical protein